MKPSLFSLALVVLTTLLAGCGGGEGVRIRQTVQQEGGDPRPINILGPGVAFIVHVDSRERIVTIRNGHTLDETFYLAVDREGEETAALKLRPLVGTYLRMADILEGEPSINNRVRPANESRAGELAKIYRDPEETSE